MVYKRMGKHEEAFSKNKEGVNEMNIILDPGAFMPEFAHKTDAGADLRKEANKNRQKR